MKFTQTLTSYTKGILFTLVASVAFAAGSLFVASTPSAGNSTFLVFRNTVAGSVTAPGIRKAGVRRWGKSTIIVGTLQALYSLSFLIAVQTVGVVPVAIVGITAPGVCLIMNRNSFNNVKQRILVSVATIVAIAASISMQLVSAGGWHHATVLHVLIPLIPLTLSVFRIEYLARFYADINIPSALVVGYLTELLAAFMLWDWAWVAAGWGAATGVSSAIGRFTAYRSQEYLPTHIVAVGSILSAVFTAAGAWLFLSSTFTNIEIVLMFVAVTGAVVAAYYSRNTSSTSSSTQADNCSTKPV